jgi:pimeloyl-ACP methyl ester carboxylesterase
VVVAEPNLTAAGGLYSSRIAAYREDEFVEHGFARVLAQVEPGYAARLRMADPLAVHRSAVGLVTELDPSVGAVFAGLAQPRALLVGARNRRYADRDAVRAAGIPVIEVPGAGHDMMHDNPAGFAAAVRQAAAHP